MPMTEEAASVLRKRIDGEDFTCIAAFRERFGAPPGVMITRELTRWDAEREVQLLRLEAFLAAF